MGDFVAGERGRSRARRGSLVWGEVIGADLRCGVGEFRAGEAVALWSVSGAERAARGGSGEASVWGDSGGCSGRFELPRSTRKSRQPAANFEPAARKMTDARRSHLMHSMTQGFILSDSQKGIALMRRGLRA